MDSNLDRIAALERELAAERARLDWWIDHNDADIIDNDVEGCLFYDEDRPDFVGPVEENRRAWRLAIDAAMRGGK